MNKELTWWAAFMLVAVLVAAQMSDFEFRNIDIQLHDTYYILPWYCAVLFIIISLGMLRGVIYAIEWMAEKSSLVAWIVVVVNTVLSFFWTFLIFQATMRYVELREWYPELPASNYQATLMMMCVVLCLIMIVEVKLIRRLRLLYLKGN